MPMLFLCLLLLPILFAGQGPEPHDLHYLPPLDIPLTLSGNFCEIRYNHYHTGLDIRTNDQSGLPVYASDTGYVSRIRLSPFGYGLAVYIDHPDGYTTVYAHLSAFSPPLAKYVREMMEHLESYSVDLYPEPGQFRVSRGEVIGWSGNSGSSTGPHLHYEIRETVSEFPVNPLLYGLPVADHKAPVAERIFLYRAESPWGGPLESVSVGPEGTLPGRYKPVTLSCPAGIDIGLALAAYDQMDGSQNRNGLYAIRVTENGNLLYDFRVGRLSFDDVRFVNAHIDYRERQQSGKKITFCFRQPGDLSPLYPDAALSGILKLVPGQKRNLQVTLEDASGNRSIIPVTIQAAPQKGKSESGKRIVDFSRKYSIDTFGLKLVLPAYSLYCSAPVPLQKRSSRADALSDTWQVGYPYIPLQHYMDISLSAGVPDFSLREKTLMIRLDHKNRRRPYTGHWNGRYFTASVRDFGTFYLATDTIPPRIEKLTAKEKDFVRFRITDNLAGIKQYRVTLDGKWVYAQYTPGRGYLDISLAGIAPHSEHILEISVSDYVDNRSTHSEIIKTN